MTDKATQIAALLAPTVESLGVELLGIEYLPAAGNATLRIYIDVPAAHVDAEGEPPRSVTIEECEAVSREVSAQLDVEDPISSNYTLEVSSPGIDRPLFTLEHYRRFVGETAKVTLKLPHENRRRLQGEIVAVEGEQVTFAIEGTPDGSHFTVPFSNIDKGRIVPDWAALGFAPSKGEPPPARADKPKPKARPGKNKPSKPGLRERSKHEFRSTRI
ncbi:ribosome maturation factor [Lysobacter capsici AZ78]|uniref:Ribosome maturation factor RimP n=1 Tax=Lysobacter capsici AZ78 TaxID=1444315 RepID=A0A125U0D1_9GAMM|nr:ribosome maturation factor RimP [Lysobacter capsici]KWS02616.1 ribosome maturation factor [Lysobacter capsici AZ78]